MSGPPSWKIPRSHLAELSKQMMGEVQVRSLFLDALIKP